MLRLVLHVSTNQSGCLFSYIITHWADSFVRVNFLGTWWIIYIIRSFNGIGKRLYIRSHRYSDRPQTEDTLYLPAFLHNITT